MCKVPPLVPHCLFMAKFPSCAKRRSAELELEITLIGSQPSIVKFSVDVDSQGETLLDNSYGAVNKHNNIHCTTQNQTDQ